MSFQDILIPLKMLHDFNTLDARGIVKLARQAEDATREMMKKDLDSLQMGVELGADIKKGEAIADQWGPGKNALKEEAFELGKFQDGVKYELFHGEHPHSRDDNNVYARLKSGVIYEFDGHRIQVKISIETFNYLKSSGLTGDEIKKGGRALIFFDNVLVYGLTFRDPLHVLLEIHQLLPKLFEFPIDWKEVCQEGTHPQIVDRKIYYHDVPATITNWFPEQGCVMIEAVEGRRFPKPAWREEEEEDPHRVKDDIFSPHIWWFRKEKP